MNVRGFLRRRHLWAAPLAVPPLLMATAIPAQAARATPGWQVEPTVFDKAGVELRDISCTTATSCMAVGGQVHPADGEQTFAARRRGPRWTIEATPVPSGAAENFLSAVSCTSPASCVAVGAYRAAVAGYQPFAESRSRRGWRIDAVAVPTGAINASLASVSCSTTTDCIAVGSYDTDAGGGALAERWNGYTWTRLPDPAIDVNSVSCSVVNACTAVGRTPDQAPLAESWNGTAWTVEPTRADYPATLEGVSCFSPDACMAVGTLASPNGTTSLLGYRWDGKTWTLTGPATPRDWNSQPPAGELALTNVSCPNLVSCTAVGRYSNQDGGISTLAETWTPSRGWTIEPTVNPSGFSYLAAVSCASATCTAVGGVQGGSLVEVKSR